MNQRTQKNLNKVFQTNHYDTVCFLLKRWPHQSLRMRLSWTGRQQKTAVTTMYSAPVTCQPRSQALCVHSDTATKVSLSPCYAEQYQTQKLSNFPKFNHAVKWQSWWYCHFCYKRSAEFNTKLVLANNTRVLWLILSFLLSHVVTESKDPHRSRCSTVDRGRCLSHSPLSAQHFVSDTQQFSLIPVHWNTFGRW